MDHGGFPSFISTFHADIGVSSFSSVRAVLNERSCEAVNAASNFVIYGAKSECEHVERFIFVFNSTDISNSVGDG